MFHGKSSLNRVLAVVFVFVLAAAGCASAHLLVANPDKFSAPVGEQVRLATALSEPLITMVYSRESLLARNIAGNPGVANLSGSVFYKDGAATALAPAGFAAVCTTDAANTNPASADANVVSFKVEKEGTVVVTTRLDFNSGKRPTIAFAKTFLNRAADGATTRRVAGDDVLEIVPADDVASVAKNDTVKVQVFLRGKPLAGAEVSATYDGAPRAGQGDEPDNNEYLHVKTDADGKASFTMDREGTWVIGVEYIDEAFDPQNPAYTPSNGARYRGTLLFPVVSK